MVMCVLIDNIIGNLFSALFASFVFYLIVEKYPRYKRMKRVITHLQWILSKIIRIGNHMLSFSKISDGDSLEVYKKRCKHFDFTIQWGVDIKWNPVSFRKFIEKDIKEIQVYLEKILAYAYYLDDDLLLEINKLAESRCFEYKYMILDCKIEQSDFFAEMIYEYKEINKWLKEEYNRIENKKDDSFLGVCIGDLYRWLK